MTTPTKETSLKYLQETIHLAQQSPPKPTNFRVGCVIVSFPESTSPSDGGPKVISTGYTLELPGNTHAEQCALSKLATSHSTSEDNLYEILTPEVNAILYTSLEPCGKRLSGNAPCVQRIIATRKGNPTGGIRKVVFGAKEPGTFVRDSQSCRVLSEAGVEWEYLPEFEKEILRVAMEGHEGGFKTGEEESNRGGLAEGTTGRTGMTQPPDGPSDTDHLPVRDEATQPRNRKKRMMEAPPGSEEAS